MLVESSVLTELEACPADDRGCREFAVWRGAELPIGLEEEFCAEHPSMLGRLIQVRASRVAGEDIGQSCMNRSCFDDVELEHVVPPERASPE